MAKKQFLSKLNKPDYNNMLEAVLETKPFTADTKSLLLSMLYKIEISYNDYSMVKRNVIEKKDFIELIISTIHYKCDQIKLVEPNSEIGLSMNGKHAKVENNEITALPTEYALLCGISELIPQDFIVDCVLEEETKKILRLGYISDVIEVISDYDGWTWNISKISAYSLLYRNIKEILGYEFIEQWCLGKANIKKIRDKIFNSYNGETQQMLFDEVKRVIAKGFIEDYPEKRDEYIEKLNSLRRQFEDLNNTVKYVTEISNKKKEINKRIKEIDKLLADSEYLKQRYQEENASRPLEKKIFSIRRFGELLQNERDELYNIKVGYNKEIEPAFIMAKKDSIKLEIKQYECIERAINKNHTFEELVINCQAIFLKAMQIKIERAKTNEELIDLIYFLRYYKNTRCDEYLKNNEKIKEGLKFFENALWLKTVNMDLFVKFTDSQFTNIDIISNILDTKIIELEDISIIPKDKDGIIVLEIYDGEVLDRTIELDKDIKLIQLKKNKKTKLFI